MTPLLPAPQPSSAQALPAPGRGGLSRPPEEDSFALVLEQGQAALQPASADAAGERPADEDPPLEALALAGMDQEQPLLPLQPAAPWPPAGLAGLFLSAAAGEAAEAPAAMALPAATAAAAAAAPAPGSEAGPLDLIRPPASATETAGADESAGPAPVAFALPEPPAAPPPRADAAPMLAAPAPTPDVRAGDFGERFGVQLQWMAGQQIGHARIRVTPQELGPVEVVLRLDGERISADFISSHPETRQALEQGLPRLRDLLGEHGFQLAHADVGHQSSSSPGDGGAAAAAEPDVEAAAPSMAADDPAPTLAARGLLDAYA